MERHTANRSQDPSAKKACAMLENLWEDEALFFSKEFRDARARALADSEGWQSLIFVFERLAKFVTRCQRTTIGTPEAAQVFFQIIGRNQEDDPATNPHVKLLLQQVVVGRNSEFHGGAAARRFARHCVEFSFLLEEGLKEIMNKNLGSVMSSPVISVETWQMLADLRRLMLENSFTWIPLRKDDVWRVVSDHALICYLRKNPEALKTKTVEAALCEENGLVAPPLEIFYKGRETQNEELLVSLTARPVLVSSTNEPSANRVIGIVTAFDLL